jgi:hypothetical protein
MENFNVIDPSELMFLKVNVSSNYVAATSVYLIVNNVLIKPAVAESEGHENGCIDLDYGHKLQWKSIGMANIYKGNSLLFITTIYDLPVSVDTSDKAKKFILENIKIDYYLQQGNDEQYQLNENDKIVLSMPKTAIIYKEIKIS